MKLFAYAAYKFVQFEQNCQDFVAEMSFCGIIAGKEMGEMLEIGNYYFVNCIGDGVECPSHGLTWNLKTGELLARAGQLPF